MKKQTIITTSIVAGAVVLAGVGVAIALANAPSETPDAAPTTVATTPAEVPSTADAAATPEAAPAYDTATALLFLIEEEKLAHDVYVTLGDLWGSNIFTNIVDSETTHQDLVAPLLADRGIADPRSTEVGVFTDPDLQALYDELIARGSTSLAEAIQVGIVIEEKDIADLSAAIAAEDDADVISVLERLLAGSENHLVAFQRQA